MLKQLYLFRNLIGPIRYPWSFSKNTWTLNTAMKWTNTIAVVYIKTKSYVHKKHTKLKSNPSNKTKYIKELFNKSNKALSSRLHWVMTKRLLESNKITYLTISQGLRDFDSTYIKYSRPSLALHLWIRHYMVSYWTSEIS